MSGGRSLGHWEVKNCDSQKALAVCKQSISTYHDPVMPVSHVDLFTPCKEGWESRPGLRHCYKVSSFSVKDPIKCLVFSLTEVMRLMKQRSKIS